MAKFAAKDSNKNITLSPHGTGKVVVGTGAADAIVQSDGDHDLVLQTGNSTTGKITITDGADGNITIDPNGTGLVDIQSATAFSLKVDNLRLDNNAIISTDTDGNIDLTPDGTGEVNISKVDINSGAIDGVTIGTNDVVTDLRVDNIKIDGNTISSTNTDGNITLDPNGTGLVDINSATAFSLKVDNLRLDGNAITSTDTDGNIDLTPNGTGEVNVSKVDIDSGTIDGTSIATSNINVGTSKTLDGVGTFNVSNGTLTTSPAQNTAIIAGGDFPTGKIINSGFKYLTSGNHQTVSTAQEAAVTYESISVTSGNTIVFGFSGSFESYQNGSSSVRSGKIYPYHSTSAVSEGDTSSLGTKLGEYLCGRIMVSGTTANASSLGPFNAMGVFEATQATHYVGIAFASSSTLATFRLYRNSDNTLLFYFYEIQGDVLT